MKINTIHQDLKELYKEKSSVKSILGAVFEHEDEVERCMNLFNSGFWSVTPFAFETYETYGIQLHPQKKLKQSNVVLGDKLGFKTIAPDLSGFIPFGQLEMLRNPKFIRYILDDWNLLDELSSAFRKYTDDLSSLDFLKEYLHNPEKVALLENPSENYSKVYLEFWNHYNHSPEQLAFSELIQKMKDDEAFLPDFEDKDYGIWNSRAYNAMAQRAFSYNLFDLEEEKKGQFYWQSFNQPHGFDAEIYNTEILPPSSARSESQIVATIGYANPDRIYQFTQKIQNDPLFKALECLIKLPQSYNGDEHIKAAKILDEELNNPLLAWNALVTAGYWSGVNFQQPNLEAWQAAIDLAHKHDWTEIHEVLTDQLKFYNFYK
ncbi:hypothetical protein [Chryseobacterium koreense]|uniref:hypothetical protein n=1 Tax=Chryseobacterium koreense TaxID=232216 RepID=UPI0026E9B927|nr:hypothetical protein [Chryseobacterium koreense]